MNIDDASAFIVDCIRTPRTNDFGAYGYELYLPNIIVAYIVEVEKSSEHQPYIRDGQRARNLSPTFFEAAWDLCRRGVLRPGIARLGGQATDEGASGSGYSVTALGREWIANGASDLFLAESGRVGQLFKGFSSRFGEGYLQRSSEAVRCHKSGAYLACCAMCGAAAESMILAVAIAKIGDEAQVLVTYRGAQGRKKLIDAIVGKAMRPIAEPFRTAAGLLSYWRDDAAHGTASTISEIEAHEALARLIRFSQFASDNWTGLTTT